MWFAAVVVCGLSGPVPCDVRVEEKTHATRTECRERVHTIASLHGLPSGALQRFDTSSGQREAGKASTQFFNVGCVAFTEADQKAGTPLIDKIGATLGPRAGAIL
jgi:hypothetical protein